MSGGSIQFRSPTADQRKLLDALLKRSALNLGPEWMEHVRTKLMDDGGMGSFQVTTTNALPKTPSFGRVAAELKFTDEDGVLVLVTLNTDSEGEPFEVDIWKTDFTAVIRVPEQFSD